MSLSLLAGCAGLGRSGLPTPWPAEFMPTAIALTLEAQGIGMRTPTRSPGDNAPLGNAAKDRGRPSR